MFGVGGCGISREGVSNSTCSNSLVFFFFFLFLPSHGGGEFTAIRGIGGERLPNGKPDKLEGVFPLAQLLG